MTNSKKISAKNTTARARRLAPHGFVDPRAYDAGQMRIPSLSQVMRHVVKDPGADVSPIACWHWTLYGRSRVLDSRGQARYHVAGCDFSVVRLLLAHRLGHPPIGPVTNLCMDAACVNLDHWQTSIDAAFLPYQLVQHAEGWVLYIRGELMQRDTVVIASPPSVGSGTIVVPVRHVVRVFPESPAMRFEVMCGVPFDPLAWQLTMGEANCLACIR